jgi:hypothetical protein
MLDQLIAPAKAALLDHQLFRRDAAAPDDAFPWQQANIDVRRDAFAMAYLWLRLFQAKKLRDGIVPMPLEHIRLFLHVIQYFHHALPRASHIMTVHNFLRLSLHIDSHHSTDQIKCLCASTLVC